MIVQPKTDEWTLTAQDRCDAECSAQAYVRAIGVSGELLFCSHHWNKIVNNAVGYDAMEKFAYNVIDERERLIENRLIGSEN
jgi:hypothetical protein